MILDNQPTPDFTLDLCHGCGRKTRVFEFDLDGPLCGECYRAMVERIDRPEDIKKEDDSAPS